MKSDYDLEERLLEYSARIIRLVMFSVIRIFVRSIQTAKQRKEAVANQVRGSEFGVRCLAALSRRRSGSMFS